MLIKVLETDVCFHRGPAFGEHGGRSFHRAFGGRHKFHYFREFCKEFERYVKKGLVYEQALSIGPLLGKLEWFVYWDV